MEGAAKAQMSQKDTTSTIIKASTLLPATVKELQDKKRQCETLCDIAAIDVTTIYICYPKNGLNCDDTNLATYCRSVTSASLAPLSKPWALRPKP